jgi:hypothetical protein
MCLKISEYGWRMVAHSCNPSYSAGGDRIMVFETSLGKKISETLSEK